jgi:hypothetical protein
VSFKALLGYFTGLQVLGGDLPLPVLIGTATVVHLLDSLLCRLLAHNNGYPKNLWTILGAVFGIWALFTLVLLPKRQVI